MNIISYILAALSPIVLFLGFGSEADFYNAALQKKPQSVLGNRISIQLPDGSSRQDKSVGTTGDIFSNQDVLVYSRQGKKVIVVARELFAYRASHFSANLVKMLQQYPQFVGMRYKINGVDRNRFLLEPSGFVVKNKRALVRTLFLVNQDNTVLAIDVYMNAEAVKDPKAAVKLATRILLSVKPGKRKLTQGPKAVILGDRKAPYPLRLYLPRGYVISTKKSRHARVHIINKLRPVGEPPSSLAIYIGDKPSPFASRYRDYSLSASTVFGRLLGGDVRWSRSGKPGKQQQHKLNASKPLPGLAQVDKQYYIHVFVNADSKKTMQRLMKMAANLKFKDKALQNRAVIAGRDRMPGADDRRPYTDRQFGRTDRYPQQPDGYRYGNPPPHWQERYPPPRYADRYRRRYPENREEGYRRYPPPRRYRYSDQYQRYHEPYADEGYPPDAGQRFENSYDDHW